MFSKTTKTEWILFIALIVMAINVLFLKNATDFWKIFMRYKNGTTIHISQGSFKLNDDWYIIKDNNNFVSISSVLPNSYEYYDLHGSINKKPNKSYLKNINQVINIKTQKYRGYNISYIVGKGYPNFFIITLTDKNKNQLATVSYNQFFDDTIYLRLFDDIIDHYEVKDKDQPNQ